MRTTALHRIISRAGSRGAGSAQRCELCGGALAGAHSHVLDERHGEPLCACRACALLFERDAAGRGHYRLVPDRYLRLEGVDTAGLGIPVGLAFFVRSPEPGGHVVAHYPSPLGVTRWELDEDVWARATEGCEPLRAMLPAVEALLVNTARGADEQWLVPVDACHRLVAVVRSSWQGLSGGSRVWPEIERFFADLAGGDRQPGHRERTPERPRERTQERTQERTPEHAPERTP